MAGQDTDLKLSTKLYYGFGSVAYGIKDNGFAFFLLIYYNQVLGLEFRAVGLAILIALLIDAVTDPLIGQFSDNLHHKWGRRHPFMYISVVPVMVSFYFLWSPPQSLSQGELFYYLIVMAVLVRICITIYEIPATALLPELTEDYDQRTSLFSFRYFFAWSGGILIAVLMYTVLLPNDASGVLHEEAYRTYGLIACVIMGISIIVSSLGTHRHIPDLKKPPPKAPLNLKKNMQQLFETLSNKWFLIVFGAGLFHAAASGLGASLNIYINSYFWELTPVAIGILSMSAFISAGIALFLAPAVSKKFGKKWGAVGLVCLGQLMIPLPLLLRIIGWFPQPGSEALFPTLLIFTILDISFIIGAQVLFSSMVADIVEDSELRTGRRSEGLFFAARTFVYKCVGGLGIFFGSSLLAIINFPIGAKPGEVDPSIITNLGLLVACTLIFLYVCMIAVMSQYGIKREDHEANLKKLDPKSVPNPIGAPAFSPTDAGPAAADQTAAAQPEPAPVEPDGKPQP